MQALLEGVALLAEKVMAAIDKLSPLAPVLSVDGGLTPQPLFHPLPGRRAEQARARAVQRRADRPRRRAAGDDRRRPCRASTRCRRPPPPQGRDRAAPRRSPPICTPASPMPWRTQQGVALRPTMRRRPAAIPPPSPRHASLARKSGLVMRRRFSRRRPGARRPRSRARRPGTALDLVAAARAQVGVTLAYDPSYQQIAYPMGDVPMERGVCSDVVIRAFRARRHRPAAGTAPRHEAALRRLSEDLGPAEAGPRTSIIAACRTSPPGSPARATTSASADDAADYQPGDVVAWVLDNGRPHIGIVSDRRVRRRRAAAGRSTISAGAPGRRTSLFDYRITGHFRAF